VENSKESFRIQRMNQKKGRENEEVMLKLLAVCFKVFLSTLVYWAINYFFGFHTGMKVGWMFPTYLAISLSSMLGIYLTLAYFGKNPDWLESQLSPKPKVGGAIFCGTAGLLSCWLLALPNPAVAFMSFGSTAMLPTLVKD
jgi:hypothetical protein